MHLPPRIRRGVTGVALTLLLASPLSCSSKSGGGPAAPPVPSQAAPTNVQVVSGDTQNQVSWTAASGATSYNLYFKVGAGATTADTKIAGVTSPYAHSGLTNGTLYSYVVTAVGSAGESVASSAVSGTPNIGPVYMTPTGSDANDGSQAHPVLTLGRAYTLMTGGRSVIRLAAGTYNETPNLLTGIELDGGYDVPGWTVGTGYSTFALAFGTASANSINTPTLVRRLEFVCGVGSVGNSIALISSASTSSLQFIDCHFVSAKAANGGDGSAGDPGTPGGAGANGVNGSCDASNGTGGIGGTPPIGGCAGGAGGAGGLENGNGNGIAGGVGGCGSAAGGPGGYVGNPGTSGGVGTAGANGAAGGAGTPVSPNGSVIAGVWTPGQSGIGGVGGIGQGGGGGGGGGAQQCFLCDNGGGNGGGGGGAGGLGGAGAAGGRGGYISCAVFLNSSSPVFTNCSFTSGNGGNGGGGGQGGVGGTGGGPGTGGTTCTGEIGAGGSGGRGGDGGPGGGGAGGPGGPSYCVYRAGTSTPTITTPTYVTGVGGFGGLGGLNGAGLAKAPDGAAGPAGGLY